MGFLLTVGFTPAGVCSLETHVRGLAPRRVILTITQLSQNSVESVKDTRKTMCQGCADAVEPACGLATCPVEKIDTGGEKQRRKLVSVECLVFCVI